MANTVSGLAISGLTKNYRVPTGPRYALYRAWSAISPNISGDMKIDFTSINARLNLFFIDQVIKLINKYIIVQT